MVVLTPWLFEIGQHVLDVIDSQAMLLDMGKRCRPAHHSG